MLERVSILFNSDLSMTDCVEEFFRTAVKKWNVEEDRIDWIALSLREAVNNAIIHGNSNSADKKVEVVMEANEKEILLKIWDEGRGFDVYSIPDPTAEENLLRPHGRGIFLISKFVDGVRFLCRETGFGIELKVNLVK
ncbi:MAG: ATP-binding protein [Acidobacteria bacterium]|nr:ATP-binding protein [Acidobacteriota bacterium]